MDTKLFDYELPEELIALEPVAPRDTARLLIVRPGANVGLVDARIPALVGQLNAGDCLVVNNTRVIPAALQGIRVRQDARAKIDLNLIKQRAGNRWTALAKPAKRLRPGDKIRFGEVNFNAAMQPFDSHVVSVAEGGEVELEFCFRNGDLRKAINALGSMPLPPYISGKRPACEADRANYQTVYAMADGAVAAPTAGLHFTEGLLAQLEEKGVSIQNVTLHVGAGTFLPVKADDTDDHAMHAEWGEITKETADALNKVRESGGRIVAVGTTSLRLLESAARDDGSTEPFRGETDIFITPGYRFKAVDVLMTNFHLPRSTLLMLVAAFSGLDTIKEAYSHAIRSGYRFYSYGDATLLFPAVAPKTKKQ